jgi:predicted dehydrogenase
MTVQVGVIGTGFGARVVAPAFAGLDGCGVVDVVSARDDAGVVALCENPDVDLICVHSPPFLHASHVRRAIVEGRAVLCDKPFGLDGDAETLFAAAEAADCLHFLNFEFRYSATRQLVRDLIAGGAIGVPEHVQWTHLSAGSREPLRPYGWLFDRDAGGGWIGAGGSHAVDFLRWTFGEIGEARAQCRTTITERRDADGDVQVCDAEDGFSALLVLGGSVTATIDSTFAAPVTLAPRLVAFGTDGVLECVADARVVVRGRDGTRREYENPTGDDAHVEPMRHFARVVCDAVRDGIAPSGVPTFADGLACARVLERPRAGGE